MPVQGSGYTREAGVEAEHCNGDGALGQGAAIPGLHRGPTAAMGDRARTGEALWHTAMVSQGGGGGGRCGRLIFSHISKSPPPPPPPPPSFL